MARAGKTNWPSNTELNPSPATYLLDGNGFIIATDLRGDALEQAVTRALAKK